MPNNNLAMGKFRFAVVSDLHIALPQTVWYHAKRFHLTEISVPAFERILEHLSQLDLDFLLLPGDLTQHGEPENHTWLGERLAQLPFPTYVIPGNHDVPVAAADGYSIGLADFPHYYLKFGYDDPHQLYYSCEILPGVRLVALNSNLFNPAGEQIGYVDSAQLQWLEQVLTAAQGELVLVMVHHNVVEHLPGQSRHPIGQRYMLKNASELLEILRRGGVQLVFTGHLHVQNIACSRGVYDITTGSLVSYPHPYRICQCWQDSQGQKRLKIESLRVESVPGFPQLQHTSREWMGDRSVSFMMQMLTYPPLSLNSIEAQALAPNLRYFWAAIADGDPDFNFPNFPAPARQYFENFSSPHPKGDIPGLADNNTTLLL